jgi:hypothetical protein
MRIDFKRTPSPLLALLVVACTRLACTSLADPDDRAVTPPQAGPSMPVPEPDHDADTPSGDPGPQRPPSRRSCEAAGQIFLDTYSVPSADACKSCRCSDGLVLCTEADCEPDVCAPDVESPDGVCSRPPLDPCLFQDPDCGTGAAATCDVAGQTFADGSDIPSGDDCNSCACDDGGVSCSDSPCDPVFCALFVEESDGVCARFPLDPCASQDPDCGAGAVPGVTSCDVAGQSFPDGSDVPSGDSCNSCGCSDGNVICTLAPCDPVECALFAEESDGVCTRFPLDPCISQDPDCIAPSGTD